MAFVRLYPYATPAELNDSRCGWRHPTACPGPYTPGTMFGLGAVTKYPKGWRPKNGAEAAQFLKDWLAWMEKAETDMAKVFSVLATNVMLGVATCEELQRYNGQAISLFLSQEIVYKNLKAAGYTQIPPPPYPRLFAHSLVDRDVGGVRTIEAKIECTGDDYPRPGMRINATQCTPSSATELGIAPLAPAAPAAGALWAKAATFLGAAFFVGMLGWGASKILRALPETAIAQMNTDMQLDQTAKMKAAAECMERCRNKILSSLTAEQRADLSGLRKLINQCRKQCPLPRKPPRLESESLFKSIGKGLLWTALGAGAMLGVYYGYRRIREM